jgi:hypothetical protein
MPKVNKRETTIFHSANHANNGRESVKNGTGAKKGGRVIRDETKQPKKLSLHEQMIAEAQLAASTASSPTNNMVVDVRNIVPKKSEETSDLLLDDRETRIDRNSTRRALIHEID